VPPRRRLPARLVERRELRRLRPHGSLERPLFCGVGKGGRLTGTAMSDKIVARLMKPLGYIESGDFWRNNITETVFGGPKTPRQG
jgi:hypothetical protein